jgi:membrane protease YdiL (CAAX protease family)
MFFGLAFINIVFADFIENLGINAPTPNIPLNTPFELVIFILTIAVLPAIFEELMFRGLLLTSLNGQGNLAKILTVALCFACYHCSVTQFFYQFIFGIFLSVLAIYSKSVIPCIITHFINNFVVLILTYFKVEIDLTNILYIAIGIVALVIFIIVCVPKVLKYSTTDNGQGLKEFYIPYGLFGIIACLVLALSSLLG